MKPITSTASARWTGESKNGRGALTTESGALKQQSYFSDAPLRTVGTTHPAELIAAAEAGSFSAKLVHELELAGFVPMDIETIATVTEEFVETGWAMTNLNLEVRANVPMAGQGDFIDAALRAKTRCSVSRLLRASISMNAKLEI